MIPYGTWVPVAVWRLRSANCYIRVTLLTLLYYKQWKVCIYWYRVITSEGPYLTLPYLLGEQSVRQTAQRWGHFTSKGQYDLICVESAIKSNRTNERTNEPTVPLLWSIEFCEWLFCVDSHVVCKRHRCIRQPSIFCMLEMCSHLLLGLEYILPSPT